MVARKEPPCVGGIVLCAMFPILTTTQSYGLMMFLVLGWLDDVLDLKPYPKLVLETLIGWYVTRDIYATIWIVFFVNAMNLSDNMDGLAIGLGVIASVAMEMYLLSIVLLLILPLNMRPARIYLGDCGSLSLGYLLSLGVLAHTPHVTAVSMVFVDTIFVAVSRPLRGRHPFRGGRDHLSHLLARRLGTDKAVFVLWGANALIAIIGRVAL